MTQKPKHDIVTRAMKTMMMILTAAMAVLSADVVSAASDRDAKKEATVWVKQDLKRLKAASKILKKVKDEKSAEAAAKQIETVYGVGEDSDTAMGEAAPAAQPQSEEMDALLIKNKRAYEKLQKAVEKEWDRIEEKEVPASALDRCRSLIVFPEIPEEETQSDTDTGDSSES